MTRFAWLFVSPVALLALLPSRALAQGVPPAPTPEALREEAARSEAEGLAATQGGDCVNACRALESMRRATDRLCGIDAAEACAGARAKLRKAAERVRAACPECATAASDEDARAAVPPQPSAPRAAPAAEPTALEAAGRKGGGCASCQTAGADPTTGAEIGLVALAVLAVLRRRRTAPLSS